MSHSQSSPGNGYYILRSAQGMSTHKLNSQLRTPYSILQITMAARKSCTHMTWSEAKAKAGDNGGGGKKKVAKKVPHDKILADKIIAKGTNQSEKDRIAGRQAARRARKDEERAILLEEKRREEKEKQRLEQVVKPHEQAIEKMAELAREQQRRKHNEGNTINSSSLSQLQEIAECKQIQLDELLALEAIFMDTETFLVAEECQLDELREKMDALDDSDGLSLKAIARHPPVSFKLQHTIDDPDGGDLVANILLHVELPALYPLKENVAPKFEIVFFMLTDKTMVCSANKPLESLGYLEESRFMDSIKAEAQMLLPDPCIYELSSTWLPENIFGKFISMKAI